LSNKDAGLPICEFTSSDPYAEFANLYLNQKNFLNNAKNTISSAFANYLIIPDLDSDNMIN